MSARPSQPPQDAAASCRAEETVLVDSSTNDDATAMSAAQTSAAGGRRFGRFELFELIGQQSAGPTYRAVHVKLKKPVVLHLISAGRLADPQAAASFRRRIAAVCRLNSPHLVRCDGFGEAEGKSYVVAEQTPGVTLRELLDRVGPLGAADACQLIGQAAMGMQDAYQAGLSHGELRLDCLALAADGTVKVAGLAVASLGATPREMGDDVADLLRSLAELSTGTPAAQVRDAEAFPEDLRGVWNRIAESAAAGDSQTPISLAAALAPQSVGCDIPALLRRVGVAPAAHRGDEESLCTSKYLARASAAPRPQVVLVERAEAEAAKPAPAKRTHGLALAAGAAALLASVAAIGLMVDRWRAHRLEVTGAHDVQARAASHPPAPAPAAERASQVSLLQSIDLQRDVVRGRATRQGIGLDFLCDLGKRAVLQFPIVAPKRYAITAEVERLDGVNSFGIGLSVGTGRVIALFDYGQDDASTALLAALDKEAVTPTNKHPLRSLSSIREQTLPQGEKVKLELRVEFDAVEVRRNGRKILEWAGPADELSMRAMDEAHYPGVLFLHNHESSFRLSEVYLDPLGEPLEWLNLSAPDASPERLLAERALWKGGAVRLWQESGKSGNIDRLEKLPDDPRVAEIVDRDGSNDGRGVAFTDDDMPLLEHAADLQSLSLARSDVTDAGLAHLRPLTGLRTLYLNYAPITDEGLVHVGSLASLEGLFLIATNVSDAGMERLQHLSRLERLGLSSTKIGNEGVAALRPALHNVRWLCYCNTEATGESFESLRGLDRLETLHSGSIEASDEDLAPLFSLPKLREIRVAGTNITESGQEELRRYYPEIKFLD